MSALFVDDLTVIDFTYLHATRGLVGESWIVDLELHGRLDAQGMVLDFGEVKRSIKREIDRLADHRLILPVLLPGLTLRELPDGNLRATCGDGPQHLLVECPPSAVLKLSAAEVTPSALMAFLTVALREAVPENIEQMVIKLREEKIDGAYYHYSHGLKKHQGACQRIAHGHRSRIEIEEDGKRSVVLEQRWAGLFRDIYIGTTDDIAYTPSESHRRFAYATFEGRYLLELPARQVYLIETDSTVELIARHIADALKRDNPQRKYRVKAFEGVAKGAIANA